MASDATKPQTSDETPAKNQRRSASHRPPGYLLLWLLTLISLIVNVIMVRSLLLARQIAVQSVHDSIEVLSGLQHQVINYTVVVDQTLPVKADIPIQTTVPIHIKDTFPINTSLTVSALGIPVKVPVSTTIPIDKTFEITIDQTFPLETSIPIHFEVPIAFAIDQTGLYAALEETKARLVILEQSLNAPLLPFLPGPAQPTPTGGSTVTPTAAP